MADIDYLGELRRMRYNEMRKKEKKEQELRAEMTEKMERELANKLAESRVAGGPEVDLDVEEQLEWLSAAVTGAIKEDEDQFEIGFKLSTALIGRMVFEGIVINKVGQPHRPNFYEDVIDYWVYKFDNYMAFKPRQ